MLLFEKMDIFDDLIDDYPGVRDVQVIAKNMDGSVIAFDVINSDEWKID